MRLGSASAWQTWACSRLTSASSRASSFGWSSKGAAPFLAQNVADGEHLLPFTLQPAGEYADM